MIRSFKYLITFVLFAHSVKSQTPYHYTLDEEKGLPSNEVYQVIQDKEGFIWLGTNAGLYRYDGVRFKAYSSLIGNSRSISELKFDKQNRLWCQNFSGQIFYVQSDSLVMFADYSNKLRNFPLYSPDNNGGIWVAAEKHIEHLGKDGKLIKNYYQILPTKDTSVWYDVEVIDDENVLVSNFINGLNIIKPKLNNGIEAINQQLGLGKRIDIEKIDKKCFLIVEQLAGQNYDLLEYTGTKVNVLSKINSNLYVYKIGRDNSGDYWICTSNGVYPLKSGIEISQKNAFLKNDKISSFYSDRENNIWLTSLQNGIHVVPNIQLKLYNNLNERENDNYFSSLVNIGSGKIIAGTYTGALYQLDSAGSKEFFAKDNGEYRLVRKIHPIGEKYLISRGRFSVIFKGKETQIATLKNSRDFCVLDDTIYFCSSNATGYFPLSAIHDKTEHPEKYKVIIHPKSSRSITCDSIKKRIYFVSIDGVYSFYRGVINLLRHEGKPVHATKVAYFNGNVWIASVSNGFLILDNKNQIVKSDLNQKIKGSQIKTFKITDNYIWVSTEVCLNKINIQTGEAEYYDVTDGLIAKEVNDIAFSENKIFLATNKGIISFPINLSSINKIKPTIKIVSIKVNDVVVQKEGEMELGYNHNKIALEFISSCMRARSNFEYSYRLIGMDSAWTKISSFNNEVVFPSLPAGKYKFEVKSVNEDGVESSNIAAFSFSVKEPFWQTLWFYLLVAASGAGITIIAFLRIIKNIRKKARIRNELINSQLTAIRAQMNPHFMYNTLNSIQDLILKGDIKHTNYYLSKFSALMRKILEFSDNEKVVLAEEVEMLRNYLELEKLRFGDEFVFDLVVDDRLDIMRTFIPSLIIQPFVENALKHGLLHKKGIKKISVRLNIINDEFLEAVIEDNGVGRKRSEEIKQRSKLAHKSFANSAVQKRLELLNKNNAQYISLNIIDLIENEEAKGTKVILKIKRL